MRRRHIFLLLLVVGLESLFLTLAHWQWQRYQQRLSEVAAFQQQTPITLSGTFLNAQTKALDNQPNPTNPEKIGWRILTPFQTASQTIIIERGWATPQPLTNFTISQTQITGIWQPFPQRKGWLKGPDITINPNQLAFLNPSLIISTTTGTHYLAATTTTHPNLQAQPQPPFNPQRHLSYCLQWLALALTLPILLLTTYFRRKK
ncbi:MAG: hypothetical protein EBQ80_03210 [Proteobacteria bacterium]|nr:hypothetical protein [Pseudomonadota bacterium]